MVAGSTLHVTARPPVAAPVGVIIDRAVKNTLLYFLGSVTPGHIRYIRSTK